MVPPTTSNGKVLLLPDLLVLCCFFWRAYLESNFLFYHYLYDLCQYFKVLICFLYPDLCHSFHLDLSPTLFLSIFPIPTNILVVYVLLPGGIQEVLYEPQIWVGCSVWYHCILYRSLNTALYFIVFPVCLHSLLNWKLTGDRILHL